jgi:hypothetical protein
MTASAAHTLRHTPVAFSGGGDSQRESMAKRTLPAV